MIKKFERIISNTQSNYKVVIRKKDITQQCSYNLPVELEAYLLNLNALKRETDESVKTKVKYVLSPVYHAVLGVNICAIIGSEYLKKRVSVIFTHTEGEDGGTPKFQLKKTDFKSKGIGYEWFVDLYNKNIEGVNFTVSVDDEKKEIMFDVELTSNVIDMTAVEDDSTNTQVLDDANFNVYGIHIKLQNTALDVENPHVCIGWSYLGDLTQIGTKEDLYNLYTSKSPEHSNQVKGANVSQIWLFKNEMKIGDYVVYFDGSMAHIGKVAGDYQYIENVENQDSDYVNNRKVEWIKDIPYSELPGEYRRSAQTTRSFFRLRTYNALIQDLIRGKDISNDDEDDSTNTQNTLEEFNFKASPITDGQNLIVYGTPGCGKSYYVEHTLLDGYSKENYIRTTFYQDYTNTDFVGQILPIIEGDKVTYKFNPGPFTLALEQAIRKPNERIALVIEELNRGSAASIFGDIFQLLDRKEGVSEYGTTNVNIINYLKEKFKGVYTFKEIRLPGNLSIYATMNTSDQNVFTLDTAFKRRWKFKKLINEFAVDHQFKNKYIPGADITWEELVNDINEYILECSSGLNSEDKQLGVYFVDENGMRKEKVDASDPEAVNAFAYKVLEYLWSDVAKFDRSKWFVDGIKSLDELVKEYKNKGLEVFVDGIFDK